MGPALKRAACCALLVQDAAGYGRRRLFASVGWGAMAPLTGWGVGRFGVRFNIWCYAALALAAAAPIWLLPVEALGPPGRKAGRRRGRTPQQPGATQQQEPSNSGVAAASKARRQKGSSKAPLLGALGSGTAPGEATFIDGSGSHGGSFLVRGEEGGEGQHISHMEAGLPGPLEEGEAAAAAPAEAEAGHELHGSGQAFKALGLAHQGSEAGLGPAGWSIPAAAPTALSPRRRRPPPIQVPHHSPDPATPLGGCSFFHSTVTPGGAFDASALTPFPQDSPRAPGTAGSRASPGPGTHSQQPADGTAAEGGRTSASAAAPTTAHGSGEAGMLEQLPSINLDTGVPARAASGQLPAAAAEPARQLQEAAADAGAGAQKEEEGGAAFAFHSASKEAQHPAAETVELTAWPLGSTSSALPTSPTRQRPRSARLAPQDGTAGASGGASRGASGLRQHSVTIALLSRQRDRRAWGMGGAPAQEEGEGHDLTAERALLLGGSMPRRLPARTLSSLSVHSARAVQSLRRSLGSFLAAGDVSGMGLPEASTPSATRHGAPEAFARLRLLAATAPPPRGAHPSPAAPGAEAPAQGAPASASAAARAPALLGSPTSAATASHCDSYGGGGSEGLGGEDGLETPAASAAAKSSLPETQLRRRAQQGSMPGGAWGMPGQAGAMLGHAGSCWVVLCSNCLALLKANMSCCVP